MPGSQAGWPVLPSTAPSQTSNPLAALCLRPSAQRRAAVTRAPSFVCLQGRTSGLLGLGTLGDGQRLNGPAPLSVGDHRDSWDSRRLLPGQPPAGPQRRVNRRTIQRSMDCSFRRDLRFGSFCYIVETIKRLQSSCSPPPSTSGRLSPGRQEQLIPLTAHLLLHPSEA